MPIRIFQKYHVLKTMTSYLCINMAADYSEQVFIKKHNRANYDVAKTLRIGAVGCFVMGPMIYTWIKFIERLIPGKRLIHVVCKVACDSCLFAPTAITAFYMSTNILEGKKDLTLEWKQKFYKTWTAGFMYWPMVQSVNFAFVPHHYKTSLYMPLCSFIWMNYMCYMKDQKVRGEPPVPSDQPESSNLHIMRAPVLAKDSPPGKKDS